MEKYFRTSIALLKSYHARGQSKRRFNSLFLIHETAATGYHTELARHRNSPNDRLQRLGQRPSALVWSLPRLLVGDCYDRTLIVTSQFITVFL